MSAAFAFEMVNFANSAIIYQKTSTLLGGVLSIVFHGIFLYRSIKCKSRNRESIEYLFLVQSACEFIAACFSILEDYVSWKGVLTIKK